MRWIAAAAVAMLALWPGAPQNDRDRAVARGLLFIYKTARRPQSFAQYGEDYLWCFRCVALTSANPELRRLAWIMGQERARQWRRENPTVPGHASAVDVYFLIAGSLAADSLGVSDPAMKDNLRRAASRFSAIDFLGFDPAQEPVPTDLPAACSKCGTHNPRGSHLCARCGAKLTMQSPWDVLFDAMLTTYTGDAYGIHLGASYADVVQWIPRMGPYLGPRDSKNPDWGRQAYAITHLIYTLNDYSRYRLRPEWLPREFAFLKANLADNIAGGDSETMGEFLDTLKSFGLADHDPLIRMGAAFVLAKQNPDGSWGDPADKDIYNRYHPTWTAVDGLRDYAWSGERVSFPEALRRMLANQPKIGSAIRITTGPQSQPAPAPPR